MSDRKIALVTGASRGIGSATAIELAKAGCFVAVNYNRSEDAALETLKAIEEAGGEGMTVKADVSSSDEVSAMFKAVTEEAGPVDILVCNAGITRDGLLMRMKAEDWDSVLAANLNSLFYCTKAAVRPMIKKRWGRIIAVSSVSGLVGNAGQCNYAASKAGVLGFVKSLAREVASRGITVNAVAPGFISTDMTGALPDGAQDAIMKNIPAGRAGTPEDVAKAIAFLASDSASYIQGHVLAVDGGMTM